jgi:hypothetical protein
MDKVQKYNSFNLRRLAIIRWGGGVLGVLSASRQTLGWFRVGYDRFLPILSQSSFTVTLTFEATL